MTLGFIRNQNNPLKKLMFSGRNHEKSKFRLPAAAGGEIRTKKSTDPTRHQAHATEAESGSNFASVTAHSDSGVAVVEGCCNARWRTVRPSEWLRRHSDFSRHVGARGMQQLQLPHQTPGTNTSGDLQAGREIAWGGRPRGLVARRKPRAGREGPVHGVDEIQTARGERHALD